MGVIEVVDTDLFRNRVLNGNGMEFNSPTFHQPSDCRKQFGEGLLILSLEEELPNGLGGNLLTQF